MAVKVKEFSWSLTQARMFQECHRRYYYHYIYSKLGNVPDAEDGPRLAAEMRRIKGLEMWVGEVVHTTVQWLLEQAKAGSCPSAQEADADVKRRLSEGWRASHQELWRQNSGDEYPNLFNHYYKTSVDPTVTDALKDRARVSIANFMASEALENICRSPVEAWLPIDRYAACRMDGLLFYVKLDFAIRDGLLLWVYDWKTGSRSAEDGRQLTCYSVYAHERWQVPLDHIRPCAAYLQPTFECVLHEVGLDEVDDAKEYIHGSFGDMLKCYRDPARAIAVMEDFPVSGSLKSCSRCNFRGLCPQAEESDDFCSGPPPDSEG